MSLYSDRIRPIIGWFISIIAIIAIIGVGGYIVLTVTSPYSTLISSALAFGAALIIFHIWAWSQNKKFNDDTLKVIEYCYLIVGAFSLLGALPIDKALEEHYFTKPISEQLAVLDFAIKRNLVDDHSLRCRGTPDETLCRYVAYQIRLIDDYRMLGQQTLLYAHSWDHPFVREISPKAADQMKEYVEVSPRLRDEARRLDERWGDLRGLGLVLLMTALGLRITKVTIEICKPKPQSARGLEDPSQSGRHSVG